MSNNEFTDLSDKQFDYLEGHPKQWYKYMFKTGKRPNGIDGVPGIDAEVLINVDNVDNILPHTSFESINKNLLRNKYKYFHPVSLHEFINIVIRLLKLGLLQIKLVNDKYKIDMYTDYCLLSSAQVKGELFRCYLATIGKPAFVRRFLRSYPIYKRQEKSNN